ncbi:MAG: CopG family transcriptional regulator [Nitrospirae bacterium]|nr:MAG: CopG family transcriptional regulator [Nitrospirota bacterium]
MQKAVQGYERITISLPQEISGDIDELKKELHVSKSELFKRAFEKFVHDYKQRKLRRAAELMSVEYEKDKELTALTVLDSEEFR